MSFETSIAGSPELPVITLRDSTTGCETEIFAFGGLLNAFRVPVKNGLQNVVDGFLDVADAQKNITNGFKSAKLSPFVCRMNKGTYHFNGALYEVEKHFMNGHAIHGILYDAVYRIVAHAGDDTGASLSLVYQYKGNDRGYPFPFEICITWKLEKGNRLSVSTTITNQHTATIPVADGWHPYFKLGGLVDEWTLQFSESLLLEYDEALLPTGNKIPDPRFLNGSSLRDLFLDNGFEWCFPAKQNQCVLHSERLRLVIEPGADYPVLQVYTPRHRKSIAIENLSGAPDNFNNGIHLILLAPGDVQTFTTAYTVTVL